MLTRELRLIPSQVLERAAEGWWIPGPDPVTWIAEVSTWGVEQAQLSFHPLSDQPQGSPLGVFVLSGRTTTPRTSPGVTPFGSIFGYLYLPVRCNLDPPLTRAEAMALFLDGPHILHPGLGLAKLTPAEALNAADLVIPGHRAQRRWNRAHQGTPPAALLREIRPTLDATPQSLLEEGRGDIGSLAPDLSAHAERRVRGEPGESTDASGSPEEDLRDRALDPGSPDDSRSTLRQILGRISEKIGGNPTGKTILDRISKWASDLPDLTQRRKQALDRLLGMFEKDPDAALRHALPLSSYAKRGDAPPGSSLPSRDPTFDLSRLAGGLPADGWRVQEDQLKALRERYREVGNRALRLGRFRQAAYIFSELLGDHSAAVQALISGHHYREAAILLIEFLRQPRRAAECLEKGGLLLEAIEIYKRETYYLQAASLYNRMNRPDEARGAFVQAAEARQHSGDLRGAAELWETSIGDPDEALRLLESAWPDSYQAGICLTARFELLGRLERHADAREALDQLAGTDVSGTQVETLIQSLRDISHRYPDSMMRDRCQNLARRTAGRAIPGLVEPRLFDLVKLIPTLDPTDKLLKRDALRYIDARRQPEKPERRNPTNDEHAIVPLSRFRVQDHSIQDGLASSIGEYFALGSLSPEGNAVLAHGTFEGQCVTIDWEHESDGPLLPILALPREIMRPVIFRTRAGEALESQPIPHSSDETLRMRAGCPGWLDSRILSASYDENDTLWTLRIDGLGHWQIDSQTATGRLLSSQELDWTRDGSGSLPPPEIGTGRIHFAVQDRNVFLGIGAHLIHITRSEGIRREQVAGPILDLSASPLFTRTRIAIATSGSVRVYWISPTDWDRPTWAQIEFPSENPRVSFTRGGRIVVVGSGQGWVFDLEMGRMTRIGQFRTHTPQSVAVLQARRLNDFAVLGDDGEMHLYRIR